MISTYVVIAIFIITVISQLIVFVKYYNSSKKEFDFLKF